MSGLGLLATAFGSYASTLGGLYKAQVEKEQAAQEKLAAEERQREWEREKTAEARVFAIDMLQRKFEQDVELKKMEKAWDAQAAAIEYQRALERIGYAHKLKLEEKERDFEYEQRSKDYAAQRKFEHDVELKKMERAWDAQAAAIEHQRALERIGYAHKLMLEEKERDFEYEQRSKDYAAQVARRDILARRMIEQGGGKGDGDNVDPRIFTAQARALIEQLRNIGKIIENAREEEKPGWIAQYNATKRALDHLLEYGEIPKGLSNVGGTHSNPTDIVNWLANE